MTSFLKLLTLLICFELIVAPVAPNLSLIGNANAESCATGMVFDSSLNRCITSIDNAQIMNATKNCAPEDAACFRAIAENELREKESKGQIDASKKGYNPYLSTVANAAAIAVPLTMATLITSDISGLCAAPSFWAFVVGASALFIGDLYSNYSHKKRIDGIRGDWAKIIKPGSAGESNKDQQNINVSEAQGMAFEMLARTEDSMEKTAKAKSTFQAIAALAFATATGLAIYEAVNKAEALKNETCKPMIKEVSILKKASLLWQSGLVLIPAIGGGVLQDSNDKAQYHNLPEKTPIIPSIQSPQIDTQNPLDFLEENNIKKKNHYNLAQAKDLASFHVLASASSHHYSSPSIELYEDYKHFFADIEKEEIAPSLLDMFKLVSNTVINNINPIPKSYAGSETAGNVVGGMATAYATLLALQYSIGSWMITTAGRITFGTILTGWTLVMRNHTTSQAEAASNRATTLRQMKADFLSNWNTLHPCTPEDRENPDKPNCYCYTAGGQINNRPNSEMCMSLLASLEVKQGNYFGKEPSFKGCISANKSFDASCNCKKNNTCLKTNLAGASGFGQNTLSMLNSGLSPISQIANGNFDAAQLGESTFVSNAMRQMQKNNNLLKKKGMEKILAKVKKDSPIMEKNIMKAAAGMPASSMPSTSRLSGFPSNPQDAVKALEQEFKNNEAGGISNNQIIDPNTNDDDGIKLDLAVDPATDPDSQVAEAMKQNFDYNNNDINPGSSTNIFELLSNRYQRSGLRRLFDENGTAPAEPANKNDITK